MKKDFENIAVSYSDKIGVLTLDRSDKLNIMTRKTLSEIKQAFDQFLESSVKSVIITGSGKAFCAGADVKEMIELDYEGAKVYSKEGQQILNFIENTRIPIIAALNGYIFGGGCELSLACDFRIASEDIKIGQPEIKMGIICGWGATQRLPRIIGISKAADMIFNGRILDANLALGFGLVDKVVEKEILMKEAIKMAEGFREKPKIAMAEAKKAILFSFNSNINKGMDYEAEYFASCFKSSDQKEGMKAFLEKRVAKFTDK